MADNARRRTPKPSPVSMYYPANKLAFGFKRLSQFKGFLAFLKLSRFPDANYRTMIVIHHSYRYMVDFNIFSVLPQDNG